VLWAVSVVCLDGIVLVSFFFSLFFFEDFFCTAYPLVATYLHRDCPVYAISCGVMIVRWIMDVQVIIVLYQISLLILIAFSFSLLKLIACSLMGS